MRGYWKPGTWYQKSPRSDGSALILGRHHTIAQVDKSDLMAAPSRTPGSLQHTSLGALRSSLRNLQSHFSYWPDSCRDASVPDADHKAAPVPGPELRHPLGARSRLHRKIQFTAPLLLWAPMLAGLALFIRLSVRFPLSSALQHKYQVTWDVLHLFSVWANSLSGV